MGISNQSWKQYVKTRLKNIDFPKLFVMVATALSLILVIGVPIIYFIWSSFWSEPPGLGGHFTLQGYESLFRPAVYQTITNTLIVAVLSTAISMIIGVGALVITLKTNIWGSKLIAYILIIQYLVPTYLLAIGWENYAGPEGIVNQMFMALPFVSDPVINIYSIWGIALVTGVNFAGVVYLLSSGALAQSSAELEEAGKMSGASNLTILRHISLRLIVPSLFISFVIVFIRTASAFGAPLILGIPSEIYVVATHMYIAINEWPPDFAFAGAIGMIILITTAIGLWIQQRIVGKRQKYATVTGSGNRNQLQLELGSKRKYLGIATVAILTFLYVLPIFALFLSSFQIRWAGFTLDPSVYTLDNYYRIFFGSQAEQFRSTFLNTMILGVFGAFAAMVLCSLASYLIVKTDSKISDIIDFLTLAPAALPSIVTGTAFLSLYLSFDNILGLYGTLFSIGIALTAQFIVYGSRATNASFTTVHDSLEESAQIAGASFVTILRRIYWPLVKPGFASGYILLFVDFIKVLTIPLLLSTVDSRTLSALIVEMGLRENPQVGAAIAVVMILFIALVYLVVEVFTDIEATQL